MKNFLEEESLLVSAPFSNGGNGGDISIESDKISLYDGNMIFTATFGSGKSGNIKIKAKELLSLEGAFSSGFLCTQVSTSCVPLGPYNAKNAGNISINAKKILLKNGALLYSTSNGYFGNKSGDAGNITLNVSENITISGVNPYGSSAGILGASGIYAESFGFNNNSGNAGNININSNSLVIKNGGMINCSSNTDKPGGVINLQVIDNIHVSGDSSDELFIPGKGIKVEKNSGIYSSSESKSPDSGASGKISISTGKLSLDNKGTISTSSNGGGNAGDISFIGKNLSLTNNATISSSSNNNIHGGAAGTISIDVEDSICLMNNSKLTTEAVNTAINDNSTESGNISLSPKNVLFLSNSDITTSVKGGTGNGGDIDINQAQFVALNKSNIIANAHEGSGGNIHIGSKNLIQSVDSMISASSKLGLDGNIEVESPDVDLGSGLTSLQTSFLDASQWEQTPCSQRTGEQISRFIMHYRDATPTDLEDLFASPPVEFGQFSHESMSSVSSDIFSLIKKGDKLYQTGDIESAIFQWKKALSHLDKKKYTDVYLSTLELLNRAFQEVGYHKKAMNLFKQAELFIEQTASNHRKILYYSNLGDLQLSLGLTHDAFKSFKKVSQQSVKVNDPIVSASLLNNTGNSMLSIGRYEAAMDTYTKAFSFINQSKNNEILKTVILINLLSLNMRLEFFDTIKEAFDTALIHVKKLSDGHIKSNYLISLSLKAKHIAEYFPEKKDSLIQIAHHLLHESYKISNSFSDNRLLSKAAGYTAKLNELNQDDIKAINNTRKAIFYADQGNYLAIQYLWQRQLGALFKKIGDKDQAIQSFENAISTLSKIRKEIFTGYRFYKDVFNEKIRPVYQELASLYIERADKAQKTELKQQQLRRAINIMENLKTAELQDYFEDECVAKSKKTSDLLERVPDNAAMIYPISLAKRLILLLAIKDSIQHVSIPVAKEDFDQTVKLFRRQLQTRISYDFLKNAKKLYSYIISPVEKELEKASIQTLLVVSGGALRLIPFSTLYNGKTFLIEKYAIASIPAISLTDNQGVKSQTDKVLLGGLSKAVQGFASLPSVKKELRDLKDIINSHHVFLNEDYTIKNISNEIKNNDYSIVHLATHGVFGGTARDSFLLTYDDKLNMNQLEDILSPARHKNKPIDLLTLSACQTALGNERASLGLSGRILM